jgi:hypothetical protein
MEFSSMTTGELTHKQNRVAIVNSVASIGRSQFNLFEKTLNHSVAVLFIASLMFEFCSFSAFV